MIRISLLFFVSILLFNCNNQSEKNEDTFLSIVPAPQKMEQMEGKFTLESSTSVVFPSGEEWMWSVNALMQPIQIAIGYDLSLQKESAGSKIIFEKNDQIQTQEGYELLINPKEIKIKAKTPQGAFYAVQSLLQLFPVEIFGSKMTDNTSWTIPCVHIVDEPRFEYRGMHLDVGRHFYKVEDVKKYIDLLAMHKLNTFHWHLTEDQGWRIEIKQYPKLTEIGGYRNGTLIGHYNDQPHQFDGKRYGGFYTQDQVKEVVQYAQERFITVIPEIELPGHAQAAIAAYPELGCTDQKLEVLQLWGVSDNVFCPTEATFEFLENVLDEVIALFPSEYIHIGGDECPKTQWKESKFCQDLMKEKDLEDEHELQSYFIQRIEKYLNKKGRNIIGWDEILEGGLAPNATVMSWRGIEGGIEAAKSGHDVIMTPTSHCYFDYYQSDHVDEPLAIGGFLPLKKVYEYEPIPDELNGAEGKFVKGVQGNVWTEYIPNMNKLEYMTFPRACALAEIAWLNPEQKNFPNFVTRILPHLNRLELKGVNAANHLYELKSSIQPTGENTEVALETLAKDATIYYTIDNSTPSPNSHLYNNSIDINSDVTINAQAFLNGEKKGRGWTQTIQMHQAAGKKISLTHAPHPKYAGGGNGSIINGVKGSNERYGDAEWLGFGDGKDLEAIIDLGKKTTISSAQFRFFKGEGQWIYLPKEVTIYGSDDGENFSQITSISEIGSETKIAEVEVSLSETTARYFKILAKNFGKIPEERQGGGNLAWLFVDEITLN